MKLITLDYTKYRTVYVERIERGKPPYKPEYRVTLSLSMEAQQPGMRRLCVHETASHPEAVKVCKELQARLNAGRALLGLKTHGRTWNSSKRKYKK